MRTNDAGLALIKSFEGLMLKAYPDPATGGDPWTIGYGHTSAAGAPPVQPGMKISKDDALAILRTDLRSFERAVESRVKVSLNENQFAALVSFTYNVGEGTFAKSSVLKAVNSGLFDVVPARLALYNRANRKVMKGLARRRAAEGRLFATPVSGEDIYRFLPYDEKPEEDDDAADVEGGEVEPSQGKAASKSSTIWAAVTAGLTTVGVKLAEIVGELDWKTASIVTTGVVVVACVWIITERIRKSRTEGV